MIVRRILTGLAPPVALAAAMLSACTNGGDRQNGQDGQPPTTPRPATSQAPQRDVSAHRACSMEAPGKPLERQPLSGGLRAHPDPAPIAGGDQQLLVPMFPETPAYTNFFVPAPPGETYADQADAKRRSEFQGWITINPSDNALSELNGAYLVGGTGTAHPDRDAPEDVRLYMKGKDGNNELATCIAGEELGDGFRYVNAFANCEDLPDGSTTIEQQAVFSDAVVISRAEVTKSAGGCKGSRPAPALDSL